MGGKYLRELDLHLGQEASQSTAALRDQEIYVEREAEEGVDWCSAFVNWCVRQAALAGTNHALAASWLKNGQKLDGPRLGAVLVIEREKRAGHVAFLDKQAGEWKLLGGNQKPTNGKGDAIAVSLRPFYPKTVMAGNGLYLASLDLKPPRVLEPSTAERTLLLCA